MADTGAPWNIPYAEPSDLVRDWPALSEDVAEAVADGLDAVLAGGIGSNVVQTVKTDTFSTTSTSFTDVTGLTASITPTSTDSKVLVIATVNFYAATASSQRAGWTVTRGTTNLVVPASPGSRQQVAHWFNSAGISSDRQGWAHTYVTLDSPNTDSSTQYRVRAICESGGTAYVNRGAPDADANTDHRSVSTLTLIEVAG
jgi:hypothetical protein